MRKNKLKPGYFDQFCGGFGVPKVSNGRVMVLGLVVINMVDNMVETCPKSDDNKDIYWVKVKVAQKRERTEEFWPNS